jgi:hypothetical protein
MINSPELDSVFAKDSSIGHSGETGSYAPTKHRTYYAFAATYQSDHPCGDKDEHHQREKPGNLP